DPAEHLRRSLYLFRKRNVRYPMFDAFDAPDTQTACPQRAVSTHALQALVMLNSDFAAGRAKALAGRLYRESAGAPADPTHPPARCPGPFGMRPASRRDFLRTAGNGFGMLGLSYLLQQGSLAASKPPGVVNPLAAHPGHFPARAKRCIFLFMTGGPSHIDIFD